MTDETTLGGDNVRFQPTAWTVVRSAADGSRDALDRLIAVYWKPAYFFIRRRGHDVESAKDLTQGFFGSLLERRFPAGVDADRGSFRNYLLGALSHFLSDEKDRANAKKRGAGFNFVEAEADLVSAEPGPEQAFRSRWARELLSRAMTRLRQQVPPEDLALLSGAPRPDLSVTDRKNRLFRLRARLKQCLREEILPSVDRPEGVDSEIRELFSAFS
ncbi:MAG: sigma-70 family RNA polymerase sigma factor [Planctomycetaceae bacterium]|nr:sigma-70 family RNA polymerase sigma factor [Planctomycetaceae bacterium]